MALIARSGIQARVCHGKPLHAVAGSSILNPLLSRIYRAALFLEGGHAFEVVAGLVERAALDEDGFGGPLNR